MSDHDNDYDNDHDNDYDNDYDCTSCIISIVRIVNFYNLAFSEMFLA